MMRAEAATATLAPALSLSEGEGRAKIVSLLYSCDRLST